MTPSCRSSNCFRRQNLSSLLALFAPAPSPTCLIRFLPLLIHFPFSEKSCFNTPHLIPLTPRARTHTLQTAHFLFVNLTLLDLLPLRKWDEMGERFYESSLEIFSTYRRSFMLRGNLKVTSVLRNGLFFFFFLNANIDVLAFNLQ